MKIFELGLITRASLALGHAANAELKMMSVTGTAESMDSAIRSKLGWLSAIILAANLLVGVGFTQTAQAAGTLFIGSDVEEFSGSPLPDKIGKFTTSAGTITGGGNVLVDYFVNGMTVVGADLLTGTVTSDVLRTVGFDLVEQSSVTADIPSVSFNEDMAFDGTNVWHAHFTNNSSGEIRRLDPNDLGGTALDVFSLSFGVVGVTVAEVTSGSPTGLRDGSEPGIPARTSFRSCSVLPTTLGVSRTTPTRACSGWARQVDS